MHKGEERVKWSRQNLIFHLVGQKTIFLPAYLAKFLQRVSVASLTARRVLICEELQDVDQCSQTIPNVQTIEHLHKGLLKLEAIPRNGIL